MAIKNFPTKATTVVGRIQASPAIGINVRPVADRQNRSSRSHTEVERLASAQDCIRSHRSHASLIVGTEFNATIFRACLFGIRQYMNVDAEKDVRHSFYIESACAMVKVFADMLNGNDAIAAAHMLQSMVDQPFEFEDFRREIKQRIKRAAATLAALELPKSRACKGGNR